MKLFKKILLFALIIGGPTGLFYFLSKGEYYFKKLPVLYGPEENQPYAYDSIDFIDQDGKHLTAADFKDKIIVVTFMEQGCPYDCKIDGKMMKLLVYNESVEAKGFKDVILITETNDSTQKGRKIMEESLEVKGEKWKFVYSKKFSFYNIKLENGNPYTSPDEKYKNDKKYKRSMLIIDKKKAVRGFLDSSGDIEFKRLMEELRLLKKEYAKKKTVV
jgi:cytochrome oxidase Cu insertion factor (SCO1/SenC/PrrC family)